MMISEIIRPVQVGLVKYSYQVIKTVDDLKLIEPYLIDAINEIEQVLPSVIATPGIYDHYSYYDGATCKLAHARALADAISERLELDFYLRYLRRIYIVSGLASSDAEVGKEIKRLYDMAMYIKINEEEE